ncbi:conjugal transfer protein TraO [Chryseobacterium chendengshani]|uniref:conjugal transfer protein TraO n=1 Tax=Chryseobacterium sp. LJ668 TaxID=2864040 RepID=UPI001C693B37|nr:conjugal transfer protein TraO [Chryseobacterium sp. LJ668]MBW8523798.1 conjugal transfer protein TraO [Chryseobacterium sp. LJ668]QYK16741.1 conjugal transfer protein TraO [Chryseobacterium sp. LJ668]
MRKFIMIMVLLIASHTISAQRMLPKQKGVEITSGLLLSENSYNYFINAGLIVHAKKGNYLLYALEYSREVIPYRTFEIPVETISAEAGYSLNLIGNRKKSLMVNTTLSAVAGYEIINRGESILNDGSVIIHKSSFVYGAAGRISAEIYLSDRFTIIASGRTKILWNTSRNQFTPSVGIGVRINL